MKLNVIKIHPKAKCIWRDGARISYEIWDGNKRLSNDFCLSAKEAWKSAAVTLFQKSVTEKSSKPHAI